MKAAPKDAGSEFWKQFRYKKTQKTLMMDESIACS